MPLATTVKAVPLPALMVEFAGWVPMLGGVFTVSVAAKEVTAGATVPVTTTW